MAVPRIVGAAEDRFGFFLLRLLLRHRMARSLSEKTKRRPGPVPAYVDVP